MSIRKTTKTQRVCDVTGGTRKVLPFLIRVQVLDGADDSIPGVAVLNEQVDLAPRGRRRLLSFIERGLTPIGKGGGGATPPAEEPPQAPVDRAPPTDPSEFDKQL